MNRHNFINMEEREKKNNSNKRINLLSAWTLGQVDIVVA